MLRGLGKLTWIEIKIFLREPMGAIGTIVIPSLIFLGLERVGKIPGAKSDIASSTYFGAQVPVLVSLLIAINAVLSLVTIVSIYREGGILKRLRATPLRPQTILTAHVIVKLLLTAATLILTMLAGKRYLPANTHAPLFSFSIALLISTWSILSIGFLIASMVPTARFAQPIGALILYPMIGFSGLFFPIRVLPPALYFVARLLPLTYAVNLLRGIWNNEGWLVHMGDVAALVAIFLVFTAISGRVFRWE
jgi:ABC-2 type transport system permease protein